MKSTVYFSPIFSFDPFLFNCTKDHEKNTLLLSTVIVNAKDYVSMYNKWPDTRGGLTSHPIASYHESKFARITTEEALGMGLKWSERSSW